VKMTWAERTVGVAAFVALLLLLFLLWPGPPPAVVSDALPVRGTATVRAPVILADDGVVRVILAYADGSTAVFVPAELPPTTSPTPSPSLTPSHTPTSTPQPTAPPTNTPRPTATLAPSTTPTPEQTILPTLPPSTPQPPDEAVCYGTVAVDTTLNIRRSPVDGEVVAMLRPGERVRIAQVDYLGHDEWVYLYAANGREGWSAAYWRGQEFIRYDISDGCLDVRFPEHAVGWHSVINGPDHNDMLASFDVLQHKGYRVAVKAVDDARVAGWAVERGGIGVWRTIRIGDCADTSLDPKVAAQLRLIGQGPYLPPVEAGIWIEPDNECPPYFEDLAWLDAYTAELIRLFSERGYKVVFGTQGPGYWERAQVLALERTWATARQYHACLGYHAYAVLPGRRVADSSIWLGYRHRLISGWMAEAGYPDIPLCATEVGSGMGYQPSLPGDFRDWNVAVRGEANLMFSAWWTAGDWANASVDGQMASMARGLPQLVPSY